MSMNMVRRLWRALALSVALAAAPAHADAIADFYKGKTVTLVVSSASGGGYDALARVVARYIGKHIPGQPTVIVRNMPGAGGIVATNYLYNSAPKDGSVFGLVQNNTPFEPLFGTKEAQYDAAKFNWLGSPSSEIGLLAIWNNVPVDSIADARTHEITVGASGANSTPSFYARLLNATLGFKLKIVVGYAGQDEAFLAMERGEVDGYPSSFYNSLMSTRPTWIPEKKVKLVVQYGAAPEPEIADVPFAPDLVTNPDDKRMLETAFAPLALGRPFLMPPGIPADRVTTLRQALADTFNDPDFLAETDKLRLGVKNPRSGDEIAGEVSRAYQTPPQIVERLRTLAQGQ
jgi:tripartite-type tricarboxylate transporter receptor subunit TctC